MPKTDEADRHPSLRVAQAFLESALRTRQFSDGERLPPLRDLARNARVSPTSMLAALHQLAKQGLVTIVKNHGTYAGKPEDRVQAQGVDTLDKPQAEKWERLRVRLEQDIYSGRFAASPVLPNLRELAARYGTSQPTLRKAIQALERSRVVEPHGRNYRLPKPVTLTGQAGILFTAYLAPEDDDAWFRRDRYMEFLGYAQRLCSEANLRLLVSAYHPQTGIRWRGEHASQKAALAQVTLIGHMVWAPSLSERALARLCADLSGLHQRRNPVLVGTADAPLAIFDGARNAPMEVPEGKEYRATRIFSIARKRAGEEVCRYLMRRGHRRIAYLSACHAEPWSKDRWAGIKKAAQAVGLPDAVRAFTLAEHDLGPQSKMPAGWEDAYTAHLRSLNGLERALGPQGQEWMTLALRTSLELFRAASGTVFGLQEQAERMVAWGPTACIGANDSMALFARHYLRACGARLPEAFAWLGFDDDKFSNFNDMTSYSFHTSEIASSMIHYILAPDKAPAADRNGVVECQGLIVDRGSTKAILNNRE